VGASQTCSQAKKPLYVPKEAALRLARLFSASRQRFNGVLDSEVGEGQKDDTAAVRGGGGRGKIHGQLSVVRRKGAKESGIKI